MIEGGYFGSDEGIDLERQIKPHELVKGLRSTEATLYFYVVGPSALEQFKVNLDGKLTAYHAEMIRAKLDELREMGIIRRPNGSKPNPKGNYSGRQRD
jgi:hypothetical protein